MSSQPKSIPPRCAKWATPSAVPVTPVRSSMPAKISTNHLAFNDTGGNIRVRMEFG